jgi:hypothetical protein
VKAFKTKEFARFARREGIADLTLWEAADRALRGLVDADLGGGLIKQRAASGASRARPARRLPHPDGVPCRPANGISVRFRQERARQYAPDELDFWRRVAAAFLAMDEGKAAALAAAGEIIEVFGDG